MISIAFYKGEGKFVDRLIRWWTDGKYSHCELVFPDGQYFSADAWQNKVRYEKVNANQENWDFAELDLTAKEELVVREWCDSQEGKKYDYLAILGCQVFRWDIQDKNRYFCSEMLVEALQQIGKLTNFKSCDIDPSELAILVEGSNK